MTGKYISYLSPKLENRPHAEKGDCGVFARERIGAGELLTLWGGKILSASEIDRNMRNFTQQVLQIEEEFYLMAPDMEPSDCFNHSCDPNAGMSGQIGLIAIRDIKPDEEICLDYAMCDGSSYDEFDCQCGSPNCRGRITGEDWKRPELWERYEGYFSPYLQRRIAALKIGAAQRHQIAA
ncbi:MAG TPA: SET domain-containing protein-lysine N-methyltransferase [Anaerolineales bacterium]|nr:SET domain-containing protein-lysine N-methyltransferase [Anaerolineales bacterium]